MVAIQSKNQNRRIEFKKCVIVVDKDQPPYVGKIINDLKDYLEQVHHVNVSVATALGKGSEVIIVLGRQIARELAGASLSFDDLGEEGFVIRLLEHKGSPVIAVAGNNHQGTKFGIARLMQLISATGGPASGGKSDGATAYIDLKSDIKLIPCFKKRGIHLNGWPHKYPYSFWPWQEADWKKFIDLQSLQGVNLFYIWPFMEIMPLPLSAEDQARLEEVRRVVEYAQVQNGMEVWLMQAVNRVAKDNCGVADPRYRPIWRRSSQVDMNPADETQFKSICEQHEALYRVLNNADGYCFIDSDPGGVDEGSPNDLLKVFQHARTCLDRYSQKGSGTKIIHWLWWGWPKRHKAPLDAQERAIRNVLRMMKAELPEPWELICGKEKYLPWCQAEEVIGKTVFLPYGTIEGEPSYPGTNYNFTGIRSAFEAVSKFPEIKGVMANVQTPLLQFPNLFFWHKLAWDPKCQAVNDADVLMELAEQLYPAHKELITACFAVFASASVESMHKTIRWLEQLFAEKCQATNDANELMGLAERIYHTHKKLIAACFATFRPPPVENIDELISRLEELLAKNGFRETGSFGRRLFPSHDIVAQALLLQIKCMSARRRFLNLPEQPFDMNNLKQTLLDFFDAYLAWDIAHGWNELWGQRKFILGLDDSPHQVVLKYIHGKIGLGPGLETLFADVKSQLAAKYDPALVSEGCIDPLRNTLKNAVEKVTP